MNPPDVMGAVMFVMMGMGTFDPATRLVSKSGLLTPRSTAQLLFIIRNAEPQSPNSEIDFRT